MGGKAEGLSWWQQRRGRPGKQSFPALKVFKRREADPGRGWAGWSGYYPCDSEDRVSGRLVRRESQNREGLGGAHYVPGTWWDFLVYLILRTVAQRNCET